MKYDRKDKTKVLVLVAILVVFWIFIIFEFTSLSKKTKAKLAAHEKAHAAAKAAQLNKPGQPSSSVPTTSPAMRLAALVTPVAPPKSDPFRPIIPPRNQSQLNANIQAQPKREDAHASIPELPPLPNTGGKDALQLTGIIAGSPSTAVLRLGKEHYVVREGDLLNGQLRVQKITKNTVILQEGRATYTLRLGR